MDTYLNFTLVIVLIAVLIYYLDFKIYRRAHNVFGTLWRVSFLSKFNCLELGGK